METSAEILEGNRAKVTVTVDEATVSDRVKQQYKEFAKKYSIPGFRKGKAPRQVIDNYLGKEAVIVNVTDQVVNDTCMRAVDQNGLFPMGQPEFGDDPVMVEDGKPFTYTFEIELTPKFELSSYDNIEIKLPSDKVTDEEVQAEIDTYREHYQEVVEAADDVEIAADKLADLKISATDDKGDPIESINTDNRQYGLGSGLFPATFDEQLIGLKKGDTKEFTIDMPEETTVMTGSLNGLTEKLNFAVEVLQVKEHKLPELTDEFAKEKFGIDTAEKVYEEARNYLEMNKGAILPRLKEERSLRALAERFDGEVPQALIDQTYQQLLQNFFQQLQQQGITFDQYLQAQNMKTEQFAEDVKKQAADVVKQDLALDAWAAHKGIEVTELDILDEFAKSMVEDPEDLKKQWEESGQMFMIRQGILRRKASEDLQENAVVTEQTAEEIAAEQAAAAAAAVEAAAAAMEGAQAEAADAPTEEAATEEAAE